MKSKCEPVFISIIITFLVGMLIMTGCTPVSEEPVSEEPVSEEPVSEEPVSEEPVSEEEKVTLTFWTHFHEPMQKLTEELISEYKTIDPNVEIIYEVFPHADYEPGLIAAIASGEGPDCYGVGDWNVAAYKEKGMIAPVEPEAFGFSSVDEMKANWLIGSLEGLTIDNQIYGIPFEFNTFSLFINPNHFSEIGLDPEKDYPKTWTEVAEIGTNLKIIEDNIWKREGFDIPYHDMTWSMLFLTPLFEQAGASIINEDGTECTLDSPEALNAFSTCVEFITKHETGSPDVGLTDSSYPNKDYADGNLSMWVSGIWAPPTFADTPLEEDYMVVPLPQLENAVKEATVAYAWAWSVNPQSDNTTKAWEWINFLSSHQEEFLDRSGYLQPRLGWFDSETAQAVKYIDVFLEDMEKGVYMVRTTKFQEVGDSIHRAVQRCVMEGQDPETSLGIAKDEIDAALK